MEKEYDELEIVTEEDLQVCEKLGIIHPLYQNCYFEAMGAIVKSISIMEEDRKRAEEKRRSRAKESSFLGTTVFDNGNLRHSNIIAFIGPRGSGKTTAVSEFCEILSGCINKNGEWDKRLSYQNINSKKYRFYIMPMIDASVLEEKEDLIELIWANMYQVFEYEVRNKLGIREPNELSKSIMQEFNDVYKNYNSVGHSEKREVLGESVLVKLKNVSSSLKTREAFGMLVKNFLDLLDNKRDENCDSYLVITIDDLDLNLSKGYDMLEQLHKYLFNHRVIVLIAVDYKQLHLISEKHFVESMIPKVPHAAYGEGEMGFIVDRAKKLNDDYLLKTLPVSNRIYIPGGDILSRHAKVKFRENQYEIKDFILKKIAAKTYIYYDACGSKRHFCLPVTVRELTSYNRFLDSLFWLSDIEEINKETESENQLALYSRNYDRFKRDITDRMIYPLLNSRQRKLFDLIVERDIDKRAEYAVNFIKAWKSPENFQKLKDEVDERDYYYSDLLEGIYSIGRTNYSDKVLGHCILAFMTAEMVKEYYGYRNASGKNEIEHLKAFLGCSFGGEWFNVGSKFVMEQMKMHFPMIYVGKGRISNFEWSMYFTQDSIKEKGIDGIVDEMTGMVPYLECITLLFSNYENDSGKVKDLKWEMEVKKGPTSHGMTYEVNIRSDINSADFDMFGFIGKEIDKGNRESLIQSLYDSISECTKILVKMYNEDGTGKDFKKLSGRTDKKVEGKIKEKSIWKQWDEEESNEIIFPFYNLDMSYNIMKRVRRRMRKEEVVDSGQIVGYFRKVYGYIAEELNKEDEKYEKMDIFDTPVSEKYRLNLLDNFNKCPYIQAFGYTGDKDLESPKAKLEEKRLNEILFDILKSINIETNIQGGIKDQIDPNL